MRKCAKRRNSTGLDAADTQVHRSASTICAEKADTECDTHGFMEPVKRTRLRLRDATAYRVWPCCARSHGSDASKQ